MKPDTRTAMQNLIVAIRHSLPFDDPESQTCQGPCDGCSLKLLEYLDAELTGWQQRLDRGEQPGFKELSELTRSARKIRRVLERNGILPPESAA